MSIECACNDAVESQQFYSKVSEAFEWIKEKEPILRVTDIKNDEDSVQIYLKKVNVIMAEADSYEQKISELRISSERMIERGHFDSTNIQQKTVDLSLCMTVLFDILPGHWHWILNSVH